MEELERLRLQVKIMANTIDTQEKIIEELKRVLPQVNVIKSVCDLDGKTIPVTFKVSKMQPGKLSDEDEQTVL